MIIVIITTIIITWLLIIEGEEQEIRKEDKAEENDDADGTVNGLFTLIHVFLNNDEILHFDSPAFNDITSLSVCITSVSFIT